MIETPRLTPDLGGTISGALTDTWPALKSWLPWLIAAVVVACGGAAAVIASGAIQASTTNPPGEIAHPELFFAGEPACALAMIVGIVFALASAVRTVKHDFRMTVGVFFGGLGYSILVTLIVMLGFICLVIPGLYLFIKLAPTPYLYLLGEAEPMKKSWEVTKGRFWWTVLMMFVVGLCAQVGIYAIAIVGALVYFIPYVIFGCIPIFVAGLFAIYQFEYNAYMRWFDQLLKTA